MNRCVFFVVVILGLACRWPTIGQADADRPNVVIIYADDMGYGDLAIQNPESKIPTPHLDRLAREGMRFTDAHSSSGICTPSRYALLTGRYHWRKFHQIVQSWGPSVIDPARITMADMFRDSGYRTACIGKWHLGWDWTAIRKPDAAMIGEGKKRTWPSDAFDWSKSIPDGPLAHGFDSYFGDDVPNFPPYAWIEDDRVTAAPTVPYQPNPIPDEGSPEGRAGPMVKGWEQDAVMPTLTQRVTQWLDARSEEDKPFFLYWAWTSPHAPILPTKDWKGKTEAGPYGDFVAQSDDHCGALLDALDRNGLTENTIVVFTADNGPERYAYERVRAHQHRSAGPLRGLKRDIWEGGHRVPFLVRWPGVVAPGSVQEGLISQVDLFATLAAQIDYPLTGSTAEDSHDQSEMLRGGSSQRTSVVHNTYPNHYAFRRGDWVLIAAPSGQRSAVPKWYQDQMNYESNPHPMALYDLRKDIGQRRNLVGEQAELAADLNEALGLARKQGEVRPLEQSRQPSK